MKKLNSTNDLEKIIQKAKEKQYPELPTIVVSSGTCGRARGSEKIFKTFAKIIKEKGLKDKVNLRNSCCHGFCEAEPNVIIFPAGTNGNKPIFYQKLQPEGVLEIIEQTILDNKIVDRLRYEDPVTKQKFTYYDEIPFYKKQYRLISGNNVFVDPTDINDYFAIGGYRALAKALTMSPEDVIAEIKKSGLRGRGGAGFPTGLKWEICRKQKGDEKYIICNADEGDPGAYMDRSLLEGNPHCVIEGMTIGAYAIGATQGIIYVRTEYPLAIENLKIALDQAKKSGLLGENILGSGFNFDITIARGAGAFVCGEETALIASIEGRIGEPRQRPPFPGEKGLWNKPTNINNVETWGTIPTIINHSAEKFASIGTEKSKGTKIFSLVGKVRNTGLVEVPMGITLKEIIFDIGGGIPDNKQFKAVQTGGPSGGCMPKELLDLKIDYEGLTAAGSMMGSGGMIVMDENTCMVDVAKYFLNFLRDESCGKCFSCREGTQRMYEIVNDITEGKGKPGDIELLSEIAQMVKDASMCGLGQSAGNPVLSTLRYFKKEYEEHIKHKRCSSIVCQNLVSSPCQHICPIDTEAQNYIALIAHKKYKEALAVIKKDNPLASTVARVCHHPCEKKCRAGESGDPISIRRLKRFVTDYGLKHKLYLEAESSKNKDKCKVAVIGAGPAGLACAFYLAQKGYNVTIFEKLPVLGGMCAVGIPEYRLPRKILKTDIDYIKSAGIEVKLNSELGRDFRLDDLFNQQYKAVFVAIGAHKSMKLDIPGEDVEVMIAGTKLLSALNLGKDVNLGKNIGIIGGGNTAVDTARTILRTGRAQSITIYYRRTVAEMPAYKEEVAGAIEEGIKIEYLTAPKRFISENGKLKACEFIKMELGEMDESGRRRPVPIPGSEFKVELDMLIAAIGERPDLSCLEKEPELQFTKWGTLVAERETYHTTRKGVFAGGDLVTGPNTVIDAIAAGKVAAESIDMFIQGKEIKQEYKLTRPSVYIEPLILTEKELLNTTRVKPIHIPTVKRKSNFKEVEKTLTEAKAIKEAKRCLRCELETNEGKVFIESLKQEAKTEDMR